MRVAVIDDSLAVQASLRGLLGLVPGIEIVGCAEDVEGGIRLIESELPDVVVLDVELRDHGRGIDVLRHVVRAHPHVQVVVLSNFHWATMRGVYLGSGASAYFDKSMQFMQARDYIAGLLPDKPSLSQKDTEVLQPGPIDAALLLQTLADKLRHTLDHRILIEVTTQPDCPSVMTDPVQLESALLDLVINARDAMPQGGTLGLSVQRCCAVPASMRLDHVDPGAFHEQFVVLKVCDTGTGMPAHVRERAFEPFFSTKEPGSGRGLGLSAVHGFVRQSRGAIAIESAPGVGTTMLLYMPCLRHNQDDVNEDDDAGMRPARDHAAAVTPAPGAGETAPRPALQSQGPSTR